MRRILRTRKRFSMNFFPSLVRLFEKSNESIILHFLRKTWSFSRSCCRRMATCFLIFHPPVPKRHNPRSAFLPTRLNIFGLFSCFATVFLRRKSFISDRPSSRGKRKTIYNSLQEQYTPGALDVLRAFWELLPQKDASSIGFLLFCRREGSRSFRGVSAKSSEK